MSLMDFCITRARSRSAATTDGGGDSDHVFALLALLGFQFAPRIPDLKNRRLYSFAKPSAYPALEPLIAGRINIALIRAHWPEILRIAASIRTGTVTASLIMRHLASSPRQNSVAAALRELGRLERTLFTLVMWNIADKRKRRIYPLSSPQLQHAREAKPHGVIGPELWCGTAVLRLVKGWVLTMLVPPVKNG